jgi:hypothetical protein
LFNIELAETNALITKSFKGVTFDQSSEEVITRLKHIGSSSHLILVDHPTFPLAKDKEETLIRHAVKMESGVIEKVVITFSDDRLTYVESRGGTVVNLTGMRSDTPTTYLDYIVYPNDMLFANPNKDIVWFLTAESAHPNLFTWENPYLTDIEHNTGDTRMSDSIPDFIRMGSTFENARQAFEDNSLFTQLEELNGSDPHAQVQLNCFGVEYAGFPRKMEARLLTEQVGLHYKTAYFSQ